MQRLAFGALAHELGNVTCPVALMAQVLERDLGAAQLRSASSTLARASGALQVLTAISRALRGSQDEDVLRMTPLSLPQWWQAFSPFVTEVIPTSCRISPDVVAAVASPQRLDAITTALPPLARAMTRMCPAATTLVILLTGPLAEPESTLSRVVMRLEADSVPLREADAQRWMGLARAEARRADGSITTRRTRGSLQCILSFDELQGTRATTPHAAHQYPFAKP